MMAIRVIPMLQRKRPGMKRFSAKLLSLLLLVLPVAVSAEGSDRQELLQYAAYDQQLTAIGYRLAAASSAFCTVRAPLTGLAFHDLTQYSRAQEPGARAAFGFGQEPVVLAVAPSSPAAAAGVRIGDAVLAIDGKPVPAARAGTYASFARTGALLDRFESALSNGAVDLAIRRGGQRLNVHVQGRPGCPTRFQTNASGVIGAKANGIYVEVNIATMDFARNNDELAGMVAHELAHNILGHRVRLDAQGIRRGILGQVGRSARLVRGTEEEADRLSVYLLDRAGYSPAGGIAFLDHYRDTHPLSFLGAPTHPAIGTRIASMRAEIAAMNAMKATGKSPAPAFLTARKGS
jgi:hypothetical protein